MKRKTIVDSGGEVRGRAAHLRASAPLRAKSARACISLISVRRDLHMQIGPLSF